MLEEIPSAGAARVVGRDGELARLAELGAEVGGRAIVLVGEPGIGKTTLWEAAIALASARGVRVLAARSGSSEAQLPFAGLIDLCDRIGADELARLPTPQRQALEVALLRSEPGSEPASPTAVALGLLGVMRALAARAAVLVAIDDLQWLDSASAEALAFVARRIKDAELGFLLARRPGRPDVLEQVVARGALEHVQVGPMSLGAVRRLLYERLGLTVSRQLLRRIMDTTEGNPLFAQEVGRSLVERGVPSLDEEVPLPDSLDEMLADRVRRLSPSVRRLLLAIALSEDLRIDQVASIVGASTLDDAVEAGVLISDGRKVRASHPLLAATAAKNSRARERRELHLALAGVASEEQLRAMHLALATSQPDPELAARLTEAADDAWVRGSRRQAVALSTHALRLTPAASSARAERVLALAELLLDVGELHRLTELLEAEVGSLPTGAARGRAWLLLSDGAGVRSMEDQDRLLERALAECGDDSDLRAYALAEKAANAAAAAISQLPQAEAWALEALRVAQKPRVERYVLYALAWPRALAGRPVDDLCARSRVAADPGAYVSASAERVAGQRLLWRGELAPARTLLNLLLTLADERGESVSYAMVRLHLCELELRSGGWAAAARLLDEWAESSDDDTQFRPQYQRCRALLAAGRGDAEEAERWATEAIDRARAVGCRWDELEALRARGLAALVTQVPERAIDDLRRVWEHCEREGVRDPGAFPVGPELVEALLELDELSEAKAVSDRVRVLAGEQDHPWGRASAERCQAQVVLARGPRELPAAAELRGAAGELQRLGLRFDSARCLVWLGRAQRRLKQWRAAREALEHAVAGFDALGSAGWADRARAELLRVGGRHRATGALTPSERRVVELAAGGRSNKEIAGALYVTVNTVEVHLAHAYAKLGVRSRAQLARRLG